MDQQLGRAFNAEIVRREIGAITDLESAKRAAVLLHRRARPTLNRYQPLGKPRFAAAVREQEPL